MNIEELEYLAKICVDEPWGMGHSALASNPDAWVPYYRFLFRVVGYYKPEAVIETGTYWGMGACHMAWASKSTKVISIDKEITPEARKLSEYFPNITLLQGDSTSGETVKKVEHLLDGKKIGVLFLDSNHDGFTPAMELVWYQPMFADECLVVCDDIISAYANLKQQEEMQDFWNGVSGEKLELTFLHKEYGEVGTPGFGVSIYRRNS